MITNLQIKPCIGLATLIFGTTMTDIEMILGKADAIELLDDIEDCQSTVWHYFEKGFSLFFDENKNQVFCSVEIDNPEVELWGQKVFSLKEKQVIELFKTKAITDYETEVHEWGEKRLSFDSANIDFYFERNKLVSINYGSPIDKTPTIIHSN
jgi:hypothetical protein